jgi:hypothetical protein
LKTTKNSKKKKKELSDSVSESSDSASENGKIYGFRFQPKFSDAIDAAAAKLGMTRSNFVRSSIARAIEDAGISLGGAEVLCNKGARRDMATAEGAQKARAQIASARAVRDWKRDLFKRHERDVAFAIAQTWDNAAEKVGRRLRLDELEQCEREIASLMANPIHPTELPRGLSASGLCDGPPVFPAS